VYFRNFWAAVSAFALLSQSCSTVHVAHFAALFLFNCVTDQMNE